MSAANIPKTNRSWILQNPPTDMPVLSSGPDATFKIEESPIPDLKDGQVLTKTIYLSNDPAQRGWISGATDESRLYRPTIKKGDVVDSNTIGIVVESKAKDVPANTHVLCPAMGMGWSEYNVVDADKVRPLEDIPGIGLTHYLGLLGLTGSTAYYGLIDVIGTSAKDEIVVVSGAAGATGSAVVQLAKHVLGCKKVIGIAGGAQKCNWVKELGADACIDYKSSSFESDLKQATGGKANVFFDNVGGRILDTMLGMMARYGRIASCGAISGYNSESDRKANGIGNIQEIIFNRLTIKGFIVLDSDKMSNMIGDLAKWAKEGKLRVSSDTETIVPAKFEDIPKVWMKLFDGSNQGKLVTQLQ